MTSLLSIKPNIIANLAVLVTILLLLGVLHLSVRVARHVDTDMWYCKFTVLYCTIATETNYFNIVIVL